MRCTTPVLSAPLLDCAASPAPPRTSQGPTRDLTIFVVDVGQGDATLVLGPEQGGQRTALLIDAGDRVPNGTAIVGNLLREQHVSKLDYVVLSHFDRDHIGGFVALAGSHSLLWKSDACEPTNWFPTAGICDQGTDTNRSKACAQWRRCAPRGAALVGGSHVSVAAGAAIGRVLALGGGCTATIVAGDGYVIDTPARVHTADSPNERSIALLVSNAEGFDFLVTGDLVGNPSGAENARVEGTLGRALKARGVDIEVLRVGHHGAANATNVGFLLDILPEVAVLSTGNKQPRSYKHPRCATYERLRQAGVEVVLQTERGRTDCTGVPPVVPVTVNGSLRIDVAGPSYSVVSYGVSSPANGKATLPVYFSCTDAGGCTARPTAPHPVALHPPARSAPPPAGPTRAPCCNVCSNGQPCGDTCIAARATCNRPIGCACARDAGVSGTRRDPNLD